MKSLLKKGIFITQIHLQNLDTDSEYGSGSSLAIWIRIHPEPVPDPQHCWKGPCIFSSCKSDLGQIPSLLVDSKCTTLHWMWRQPCRRGAVCHLETCTGHRQPLLGFFRCLRGKGWDLWTNLLLYSRRRRIRQWSLGGQNVWCGHRCATHSFYCEFLCWFYHTFSVCSSTDTFYIATDIFLMFCICTEFFFNDLEVYFMLSPPRSKNTWGNKYFKK